LLYDQSALDAAWDEVKHWSLEERQRLRDEVPRLGLKAVTPTGETLQQLGSRILAIAEAGLSARACLNSAGDNEGGFLDPLRETVSRGMTPAELLLERFHGEWQGDASRIYEELSF
jgi:glutamate--cysteine ligase